MAALHKETIIFEWFVDQGAKVNTFCVHMNTHLHVLAVADNVNGINVMVQANTKVLDKYMTPEQRLYSAPDENRPLFQLTHIVRGLLSGLPRLLIGIRVRSEHTRSW